MHRRHAAELPGRDYLDNALKRGWGAPRGWRAWLGQRQPLNWKLTGDGSGAGHRTGHGAAAGCQEAVRCEGHGKGMGTPSSDVLGTPRLARGSPGPSGAVRCPGWAGGFRGAQAAAPGEVDEVVSPVDPAGEDNLASNQFFKCAQLKDCL